MHKYLYGLLIGGILFFFSFSILFSNIQYVKKYTRKDGTIVHGYYRSRADGVKFNNFGKYINKMNIYYHNNILHDNEFKK